WPCQNGTPTPKPVAQVLVGPFVSGAACEPRPSRQAHSRDRWDETVNPVPTTPAGWSAATHQQGHPAAAHVDPETREPGKASARDSHPTRKGTADMGTAGLRTRVGSEILSPHVQTWPRHTCHPWGLKTTGFGREIVAPPDRKPLIFQLCNNFGTSKYALKTRQA